MEVLVSSNDTHQSPVLGIPTHHDGLKLESSSNVCASPYLREASVTAVIESLVYYSRTLDAVYDVSFD